MAAGTPEAQRRKLAAILAADVAGYSRLVGMVEEITTALSRIRWLFVIARNSAFTYKGRALDVRQVGRELGVRYVLEGSVRKAGGRVRITAQLIEAERNSHVWVDRFDGTAEGIFELQDRVAEAVAGTSSRACTPPRCAVRKPSRRGASARTTSTSGRCRTSAA